jgi:hypothetical protein
MLADLDLLLTVVYCMADDFLPTSQRHARRAITDAEVVTLCLAQAMMGIPSDYRFIAVADKRLRHLFSEDPDARCVPQALDQALRADRGVDRALRQAQPRVLR